MKCGAAHTAPDGKQHGVLAACFAQALGEEVTGGLVEAQRRVLEFLSGSFCVSIMKEVCVLSPPP